MIAQFLSLNYIPGETKQHQGNRNSIKEYLKNGYYVDKERNGFWVLIKPSKVFVILKVGQKTMSYNVKSAILEYYGKQRISQKLVSNFLKEIENGNVQFDVDIDINSYRIVTNNK